MNLHFLNFLGTLLRGFTGALMHDTPVLLVELLLLVLNLVFDEVNSPVVRRVQGTVLSFLLTASCAKVPSL